MQVPRGRCRDARGLGDAGGCDAPESTRLLRRTSCAAPSAWFVRVRVRRCLVEDAPALSCAPVRVLAGASDLSRVNDLVGYATPMDRAVSAEASLSRGMRAASSSMRSILAAR